MTIFISTLKLESVKKEKGGELEKCLASKASVSMSLLQAEIDLDRIFFMDDIKTSIKISVGI